MKNLIVRSITGVFFVAAIVISFMKPMAMEVLFALVTGLTIWEYSGLVNNVKGVQTNRFISTIAGVYFFFAVGGFCSGVTPTGAVFIPYLLTLIYLFISELYAKAENAINDESGEVVFNYLVPLCVFIFLWANDTGAYCTGSLLGRHKLFPRISPGKSWEGSIGGGIIVLIVAYFIGSYEAGLNSDTGLTVIQWMGLGLVVVVFGTWGDLVESLFKRTLGIKDSGNILPGHGGMLDRFDSSLMAMPASVVYLYSLTLF